MYVITNETRDKFIRCLFSNGVNTPSWTANVNLAYCFQDIEDAMAFEDKLGDGNIIAEPTYVVHAKKVQGDIPKIFDTPKPTTTFTIRNPNRMSDYDTIFLPSIQKFMHAHKEDLDRDHLISDDSLGKVNFRKFTNATCKLLSADDIQLIWNNFKIDIDLSIHDSKNYNFVHLANTQNMTFQEFQASKKIMTQEEYCAQDGVTIGVDDFNWNEATVLCYAYGLYIEELGGEYYLIIERSEYVTQGEEGLLQLETLLYEWFADENFFEG